MDKLLNFKRKTFAVAPMMDWTDRHCRFFHRQISRQSVLYTEMVTCMAVVRGDRKKLLDYDAAEHPLVLQLGGSDPRQLAEASRIGEDFGYAEINLNVGCPSDKVQEGRFGACLMAEPGLVADCIANMRHAVKIPVSVKCRIGIDDQDEDEGLHNFISTVAETGCKDFTIHARKAWLKGLSPKENREVPPLNYDRVFRMKAARPDLTIHLNGGLVDLTNDVKHLDVLDGLMVGRAAYQTPWILHGVDPLFGGVDAPIANRREAVEAMFPYVTDYVQSGMPLHRITRHMLGLYHGQPGGRIWRQILSTEVQNVGAGIEVLQRALNAVDEQAARMEAA